jgi:hypothetical protein
VTINNFKEINGLITECPNYELTLHYNYVRSNKNVICEYTNEYNYFTNEPSSINFDLFNMNFCLYCSIEFDFKYGGQPFN